MDKRQEDAIAKLRDEKATKGERAERAFLRPYVVDALCKFAEQSPEFAEAVLEKEKTVAKCIAAIKFDKLPGCGKFGILAGGRGRRHGRGRNRQQSLMHAYDLDQTLGAGRVLSARADLYGEESGKEHEACLLGERSRGKRVCDRAREENAAKEAEQAAELRIRELEEKLAGMTIATSPHMIRFELYLKEMQSAYANLVSAVESAEAEAPEVGAMLRDALRSIVEALGGS